LRDYNLLFNSLKILTWIKNK